MSNPISIKQLQNEKGTHTVVHLYQKKFSSFIVAKQFDQINGGSHVMTTCMKTQNIVHYQNGDLHILYCLVLGIFHKFICIQCMVIHVRWIQQKKSSIVHCNWALHILSSINKDFLVSCIKSGSGIYFYSYMDILRLVIISLIIYILSIVHVAYIMLLVTYILLPVTYIMLLVTYIMLW